MTITQEPPINAIFEPLLSVEMDIVVFLSDWLNCDQLSNYLSAMVSHDRSDPIRYANVLSSALNEALEVSFRTPGGRGKFICCLYRKHGTDRIELTFPCRREQHLSYDEVLLDVAHGNAMESYLAAISSDAPLNTKIILLGLVANYNAAISIENRENDDLTLVIDLSVEGLLQ